ncbi:GntR family transcriptional regulator [Komagataeibacter diospyri]|nr:GntR family transcriptional regulator [Komagataeibacter diospyri]GCE88883.1 GntR family transcriptional regulator [Komagataeibacter diospyri]
MLPDSIFDAAIGQKRGAASVMVSAALRNSILSGILPAGQPLPQSELAAGFGTSIIPVREALKQLEAEGLVTFMPNRGAMVTGMSEQDIIEYSEIRASLEEMAARHAVSRMSRVDLARVEDAYDAFVQGAARATGRHHSGELNRAFHNAIYAAAQRPRLLEMIDDLHIRLNRYIRSHLEIKGRKEVTDIEHEAIMQACRRRDAEEVARLTKRHILEAADISLQVIRGRIPD